MCALRPQLRAKRFASVGQGLSYWPVSAGSGAWIQWSGGSPTFRDERVTRMGRKGEPKSWLRPGVNSGCSQGVQPADGGLCL